MASRRRIQPLAIVLLVIAIVLIVIGIIYLTFKARDLPGFLPGKPSAAQLKLAICNSDKSNRPCFTDRSYTKRGIAAIGLGIVLLVGAWYASGWRKSSTDAVEA
jgi:hypothetical protein